MKLISYNLNGIRAAVRKGLPQWLGEENPDIFCVQETKAQEQDVDPAPFQALGYEGFWHSAVKKGYSGVTIFSKQKPNHVEWGCGIEKYDMEGRVIRADYDDFSVMNVYMPSGTTGGVRQDFKMEWLDDFYQYVQHLKKEIPHLIICGDFNIANHPIDIHNPKGNKNSSGFLPEEREWLTKLYDNGFHDAFRQLNPEPHNYTWWTYRANARANNKGWRIDYFAVTDSVMKKVKGARILSEVVHSDHCPITLEL